MAVSDYTSIIQAAASRYSVPAPLIAAIMEQESQGNPNAANLTGGDAALGGSYGLMQMSLSTAQALGYDGDTQGLYDPTTNIYLGTQYLADLLGQTGGNIDAAISGYNAGLSSVRPGDGKRVGNTGTDADLSTPFINQTYVDRVKAFMTQYGTATVAAGGGVLLVAVLAGAWWLTYRKRKGTR